MLETGCPSRLALPSVKDDPASPAQDLGAHVGTDAQGRHTLDLIVRGARCGGCIAKIERSVSDLPGVQSARMNLSTARLKVAWRGRPARAGDIARTLGNLGYAAAPFVQSEALTEHIHQRKRLLGAMAVAGFALANVMMLSVAVWAGGAEMAPATRTTLHWISALIALPAVAFAGRPFFASARESLRARRANMDVPISLALLLACGLSVHETVQGYPDTYFDAALMLCFLLLIGRYLDARLRARAGDAAQRLAAMDAPTALRLEDGRPVSVPSTDLRAGALVLIPAGQRVPADCEVIEGRTEMDAHIATGESLPVSVEPGARLYSGSLNVGQPIEARVLSAAEDSFLSEVRELVEFGLQDRSRYARLADRVARAYVPVVHTLALATFTGWFAATGAFRPALLNAMAVLIITCPCALGLAIPAVQIVTTGRLFARGLIVKSGDALERLARVSHVVFDKTGTLTQGAPELAGVATVDPQDLALAATLAERSRHPLARAVVKATQTRATVSGINEMPGQGLSATDTEGRTVRFGSADWIGVEDAAGRTSWLDRGDGSAPVPFRFYDRLRDDARDSVKALHALGLRVEIQSGDAQAVTDAIARNLGLDTASGTVLPSGKFDRVQSLRKSGATVLMVGDGINDAPALASADASIALASASDISRAAADLVILDDRLARVPDSIDVARRAQARIRENLGLAVAYNVLAVPLAVAGLVNPLIAAVAMSGSSLLVTLNALRMARA